MAHGYLKYLVLPRQRRFRICSVHIAKRGTRLWPAARSLMEGPRVVRAPICWRGHNNGLRGRAGRLPRKEASLASRRHYVRTGLVHMQCSSMWSECRYATNTVSERQARFPSFFFLPSLATGQPGIALGAKRLGEGRGAGADLVAYPGNRFRLAGPALQLFGCVLITPPGMGNEQGLISDEGKFFLLPCLCTEGSLCWGRKSKGTGRKSVCLFASETWPIGRVILDNIL